MNRPTFDEIYMRLAFDIAKRSTCTRLQVGCVITDGERLRVLAVGYNGNYKGGPNKCDTDEPGNCGCLHAEDNAATKLDFKESTKIAYVTHLPCKMCAKRLINAGVSKVFYGIDYRLPDAKDLFKKLNIECTQLEI